MFPYFESISPDKLTGQQLDELLALGWYRMHQTVFTCSHIGQEELHRVHWLRYPIGIITERASHRKIKKRCQSFRTVIQDFKGISQEHRALHAEYRASIDFDGPLSIKECLFGEDESHHNIFNTKCISVFDGERLIAGGYFDVGEIAAASILHFFHPNYARYSLGKWMTLATIDYMRANNLHLYYPGYVVQGVPKMNYKLFLGPTHAHYFNPEVMGWKHFKDSILKK
ncbi:MAG: arginine-tRNA-protein transferase [Cytophagales bacterium]